MIWPTLSYQRQIEKSQKNVNYCSLLHEQYNSIVVANLFVLATDQKF